MRYAERRDRNEPEIVSALERIGCLVWPLDSRGPADLLILRASRLHLIEVKDGDKSPSQRKLTKTQTATHKLWPVKVVASVRDVLALHRLGMI